MAQIRHPDMSFDGRPKGAWREVPNEDVPYLVETYGVEVRGLPEAKETGPATPDTPDEGAEPETPILYAYPKKGGWYECGGKSYRLKDLPPDSVILET